MTSTHQGGRPAGSPRGQKVVAGPQDDSEATGPYWDVRVGQGGKLTATLVGTRPPIVVTADDEDGLRKQVRILIMRAML